MPSRPFLLVVQCEPAVVILGYQRPDHDGKNSREHKNEQTHQSGGPRHEQAHGTERYEDEGSDKRCDSPGLPRLGHQLPLELCRPLIQTDQRVQTMVAMDARLAYNDWTPIEVMDGEVMRSVSGP